MLDHWLLWVVIAYLAGSIPWAWLLAKSHGVDIHKVGSGNVGATNLGRAIGRKWFVICMLLDVSKGAIPMLLAGHFIGTLGRTDLTAVESWQWLAVAGAAVIGHIYTVWLKFKGGKGVATGLGVLLGCWPMLTVPALCALAVWILCMVLTRWVSLSSMVAAAAMPIYLAIATAISESRTFADETPALVVTGLLCGLVVLRHRSNVKRLLNGTEPKLGGSTKPQAPADVDTEAS